jgi:hypothetical protein
MVDAFITRAASLHLLEGKFIPEVACTTVKKIKYRSVKKMRD